VNAVGIQNSEVPAGSKEEMGAATVSCGKEADAAPDRWCPSLLEGTNFTIKEKKVRHCFIQLKIAIGWRSSNCQQFTHGNCCG
jgi:hypothetical protein